MRNSRRLNLTSAPAAPRGVPQAGREYPATLYLDDAMLADLLPVDLTPRVHWTTYPLTIAAVCVALIFVLQLSRGFLASVFA